MANTKKALIEADFTQFELTDNLINNLYNFNLKPVTKLVLLYLSSCYNPKNKFMFPKQKTIANKIGVSERAVIRAIQELVNEGLLIIVCNVSNRYKFTQKLLNLCEAKKSDKTEKMSYTNMTNCHLNNKKEKTNKITSVEEFSILKKYAKSKNAKNEKAYINTLIYNGSAEEIIKEYKNIENRIKNEEEKTTNLLKNIEKDKNSAVEPPRIFYETLEKLRKKRI